MIAVANHSDKTGLLVNIRIADNKLKSMATVLTGVKYSPSSK
jgi:hypothetical protein